jgi:hypothetical protein
MDTQTYMDMMATSTGEATTCNDLSGNGQITIYDAALMQWCHHQAPIMDPNGVMHQQCSFPRNVVNPNELAGLAISGINLDEHYIDIELTSPDASIIGYQFGISGMVISGVESLVDEVEFPHMIDFNAATNQVMCLSAQDSVIDRQDAPRQLVRVHYSAINASVICIDPIVDIVNKLGERTTTYIYGNCVSTVGVNTLANDVDGHMLVQPNPAQNQAMIRFVGDYQLPKTLIVRDDVGREVQRISVQHNASRTMQVDFSGLSQGVYTITSSQEDKTILAVRFVKL